MDDWVKLTPKTEADPIRGEMSYKHSRSQWPREHMLRCTTPIDEYEWWDVSTAELAAIPWVAALVGAATAFKSHTDACMREVQTHFGAHCGGYDAKGEALDAALAALDPGDA